MQEFYCKKNGKSVENMEWICSICRKIHTSSTHVVSLLQLLQGKPHYKYPLYFLITVDTERATLQITRDIFTIVSAERTTLQVQMWFPYYSFCRESHTESTRVYCLFRDSYTASTRVVSVLTWWLQRIFNRYTLNTLRKGDADLRFYVKTVQDGDADLRF